MTHQLPPHKNTPMKPDARHLPRFHAHHQHIRDQQKLARILLATGQHITVIVGHATAGGDERKLRGIPAIARGVPGAQQHTSPHGQAASGRMDNHRLRR